MIDGLQFIGGKGRATAEEFFHTVNEFMSSGEAAVDRGVRAPGAGRLRAAACRLLSNTVADIKPADWAPTRSSALAAGHAGSNDATHEVMDLLATRMPPMSRCRARGALNRLVAAQLNGK